MTGKNSYSLLQKKMGEVEKTKKVINKTSMKKVDSPNNSEKKEKEKKADPPKTAKKAEAFNPNVPDRSYGDYFCSICDSHMNSDAMWEAHITGKRHMKNVRKGDTDSKYEDLDEESKVTEEIENVKEPVVGLQYIHEIRRHEAGVPPTYNCFLCHASIATVPLVVEHILSLKHRTNFVKENNPDEYAIIEGVNLKKGQLEPLLVEACAKLEEKLGRGKVKVKKEKPKMVVFPYGGYKRNHDKSDDDDDNRPSKSLREDVEVVAFVPGPSAWKSIDIPKTAHFHETHSIRSKENETLISYPRGNLSTNERESRHHRQSSPNRDASNRFSSRLSAERLKRSPERLSRRSPERLSRRSPERLSRRSPERLSRRSPERLSRRSPERLSRRSPERLSRRSPERLSRRSPERLSRRSPERLSRRSPERISRWSPVGISRRSPVRTLRRSPERVSRRSPERVVRHSSADNKSSHNYSASPKRSANYPEAHPYRSVDMHRSSSSFEKAAEVKTETRPVSSVDISRREIAEALINLPTETFFKMTILKLKGLQLKGINELQLLVELIADAKTVLAAHWPVESKTNPKDDFIKSMDRTTPSVPSALPPPPSFPLQSQPVSFQNGMQGQNSAPKNTLTLVNDLIFGARKESNFNPMNKPQAQLPNYSSATPSSNYRPVPAASNYPTGATASNYPTGPSTFNYSPGSTLQNYQSGPNVSSYPSGSASVYKDNRPSSSAAIPGLTLADNETQQQSLNDYPASHPWSGSYGRRPDYSPYKRF